MVNRESRDTLIELIRRLFCGRISSSAYEELCSRHIDFFCGDEALWFIHMRVVFHFVDHCGPMYIGFRQLSPKERREIARCILFLRSDLAFEWDESGLSLPQMTRALLHAASLGRWGRALPQKLRGDRRAYPFFRNTDLDAVRERPRLLAG